MRKTESYYLTAFHFVNHIKNIFSPYVGNDDFRVLDGLRVMSMLWVHMGHVLIFYLAHQPISESIKNIESIRNTFTFHVIVGATFAVDTFFFISGFLAIYQILPRLKNCQSNIERLQEGCILIIKRYLRLIGLVLLSILLIVSLNPRWNFLTDIQREMLIRLESGKDGGCKHHWWRTILLISNIAPPISMGECVPWAWYLTNDFQFYILTVGWVLLYLWNRKIGLMKGTCIFISSFVIGVILAKLLEVPAAIEALAICSPKDYVLDNRLAALILIDELPINKYFFYYYIAPWVRLPSYFIGICVGFWVLIQSSQQRSYKTVFMQINLSPTFLRIIELLLHGIMITLIMLPYLANIHHPSWTSTANWVYISCSRLAWVSCLAILFVINSKKIRYSSIFALLSAKCWTPLSRLSYAFYMMHPLVLGGYYSLIPPQTVLSWIQLGYHFIATTTVTLATALLISTLYEAPFTILAYQLLYTTKSFIKHLLKPAAEKIK